MPRELPRERWERDLEILRVDVEWEGQEMTSRMKRGRIFSMGRLVELEFRLEKPHECGKEHARHNELFRGGNRVGRFSFDRLIKGCKVKCLAVTFTQLTRNFSPLLDAVYFWFHVLVPESTGKVDECRRVGVGKVWEKWGVFDNVKPTRVEIV